MLMSTDALLFKMSKNLIFLSLSIRKEIPIYNIFYKTAKFIELKRRL